MGQIRFANSNVTPSSQDAADRLAASQVFADTIAMPRSSLEVFVDLGLTDPEIANYFRIPVTSVATLRQVWGIHRLG